MDVYRVTGNFRMGRQRQAFTKEFAGKGKAEVTEQVYSIIGSMHGIGRRFINIDTVKKISPDEAGNLVAIYKAAKK